MQNINPVVFSYVCSVCFLMYFLKEEWEELYLGRDTTPDLIRPDQKNLGYCLEVILSYEPAVFPSGGWLVSWQVGRLVRLS